MLAAYLLTLRNDQASAENVTTLLNIHQTWFENTKGNSAKDWSEMSKNHPHGFHVDDDDDEYARPNCASLFVRSKNMCSACSAQQQHLQRPTAENHQQQKEQQVQSSKPTTGVTGRKRAASTTIRKWSFSNL